MANKDNNNSEKDFINFNPHKNNSSGLSFLHQQQNMELSPPKTGKATVILQCIFSSNFFTSTFVPVIDKTSKFFITKLAPFS